MKQLKRILAGFIAIVIGVAVVPPQVALAAWNPNNAVHIKPSTIENSTIAMGTHLIHLSAFTDTIYNLAMSTASESSQSTIYYKSELANGDWFDITGASSIADISTTGVAIQAKTIEALYFTHHTKSDGITYDLRTNQPVSIYNIPDPYDAYELEELLPLNNQLEYMIKVSDFKAYYNKASVAVHGAKLENQNDSQILNFDMQISGLEKYQKYLRDNKAPTDEIDIVEQTLEYVDAARRSRVFTMLEPRLKTLASGLLELGDSKVIVEKKEVVVEVERAPGALITATGDSLSNVQSSNAKWKSKMLIQGTSVLDNYRYTYYNELISSASVKDTSGVKSQEVLNAEKELEELNRPSLWWWNSYNDEERKVELNRIIQKGSVGVDYVRADAALANILNLQRIAGSDIVRRTPELEMLEKTLTPEATTVYLARIKEGENSDYRAAVEQNTSAAVLTSVTKTNAASVSVTQLELEYFIEEMLDRMDKTAGVAFLDERLALAKNYYSTVPNDAFKEGANTSIDAHIEFLTRLRSKVLGESSEQDKLAADKSDLQNQLLDALDNNKLADANDLRGRINALDDQMDDLNANDAANLTGLEQQVKDLEDQLKDASGDDANRLNGLLGAAKGDLSSLKNGAGDGSLGKLAGDYKQNGLSAIANGDGAGANSNLDGLIGMVGMDPRLALPGISSMHDAMLKKRDVDGDNSFGDQISKAANALLDGAGQLANAMGGNGDADKIRSLLSDQGLDGLPSGGGDGTGGDGTGGGDGAGGGDGTGGFNLGNLDQNSHKRNAAGLGALGDFTAKNNTTEMQKLLADWAANLFRSGNPYVYIRIDDGGNEYIPADVLCYHTSMRYLWKQSERMGTMSKKGNYYSFVVDSTQVNRDKTGTKTDQMAITAKWKNIVHVHESYTMSQFDAEAYYIPGTEYGVLLSTEMRAMLAEILGTMEGAS